MADVKTQMSSNINYSKQTKIPQNTATQNTAQTTMELHDIFIKMYRKNLM